MVAQPREEEQELFSSHPEHASDASVDTSASGSAGEVPAGDVVLLLRLGAKSEKEDEAVQFDVDQALTGKGPAVEAVARCCSPCTLYTAGLGVLLLLCSATALVLVLVLVPFARAGAPASTAAPASHTVDDSEAYASSAQQWVRAEPGRSPYARHWFGSPSAKSFHHDNASTAYVEATYKPALAQRGCYDVHEWHPTSTGTQMSTRAMLTITHTGGKTELVVDQSGNGGRWNLVASFLLDASSTARISNRGNRCRGAGSCYTVFDALRFEYSAPECREARGVAHEGGAGTQSSVAARATGSAARLAPQATAAPTTAPTTRAHTATPPAPRTAVPKTATCKPATIVNDFDAGVRPSRAKAFHAGRVGVKPYFHDWYGDVLHKDFHHDDHSNKGLLTVNYTTALAKPGCYILQEWHLGGNRYCVAYMPRAVPFAVHTTTSVRTVHADQSTNGGGWNVLGMFEFGKRATVLVSNTGTDNCVYRGQCYTVFDALRFVHVGDSCPATPTPAQMSKLSDLACDAPSSLAQLRRVPGSPQRHATSASASPVKLLHLSSPAADTSVAAGGVLAVRWSTEGVPASRDVKLSLYYGTEDLTTVAETKNSGSASIRLPGSRYLRTYSSIAATRDPKKFRVRVDVQHERVEFSSGWSDQLYAYSDFFTVQM